MRKFVSTMTLVMAVGLGSGCGVITSEVSATLSGKFKVRSTGTDPSYENLISVNPADYKDVRDNCGRVDKESGAIREIKVTLSTQDGHRARYGWGRVFARHGTEEWPNPQAPDLIADFDRIPLVSGQVVNLEASAAQKNKLSKLVFTEKCDQPIQFKLLGESDETPVNFDGDVELVVDFTAGL